MVAIFRAESAQHLEAARALFVEYAESLGRRLAEAILVAARANGCARVTLETPPSMKSARALYDGLGFTRAEPPAGVAGEPMEGVTHMALDLIKGV